MPELVKKEWLLRHNSPTSQETAISVVMASINALATPDILPLADMYDAKVQHVIRIYSDAAAAYFDIAPADRVINLTQVAIDQARDATLAQAGDLITQSFTEWAEGSSQEHTVIDDQLAQIITRLENLEGATGSATLVAGGTVALDAALGSGGTLYRPNMLRTDPSVDYYERRAPSSEPTKVYHCSDGDMLDDILWRQFGRHEGSMIKKVWQMNPGLSALGPVLSAGQSILLPVAMPETVKKEVTLWD